MQNEHDANFHILHPIDRWICHAKRIDVHPSNISWHLIKYVLLAEIFKFPISARMYHGQRVATSVFYGANQFVSQIGPRGRSATLLDMVIQLWKICSELSSDGINSACWMRSDGKFSWESRQRAFRHQGCLGNGHYGCDDVYGKVDLFAARRGNIKNGWLVSFDCCVFINF